MNRSSLLVGLLASSVALTACGGGGGSGTDPEICDDDGDCMSSGPPTPPPCAAGTVAIPLTNGYSGKLTAYAQEETGNGTCIQPFTVTTGLPQGITAFVPPSDGSVLLYFTIETSVNQYLNGYPGVSINVPPGTIVPGRTFYVAANSEESGWVTAFGPLHVAGQSVSGGDVGNNDNFALCIGYPSLSLALYSVGG